MDGCKCRLAGICYRFQVVKRLILCIHLLLSTPIEKAHAFASLQFERKTYYGDCFEHSHNVTINDQLH